MNSTIDYATMNKLTHISLKQKKQKELEDILNAIYNCAKEGKFYHTVLFEFPENKVELLCLGFTVHEINGTSRYVISWED